jgi:hypothetical protein
MPTPDLPLRLPLAAVGWRAADALEPSPRLRAALAPWRAVFWPLEPELFPLLDRELLALFGRELPAERVAPDDRELPEERELLAVLEPPDDLEALVVLLPDPFAGCARDRVDCGFR